MSEEDDVEVELQEQLQEQRDTCAALEEALEGGEDLESSAEVRQALQELQEAVRETEASILALRKERLLRGLQATGVQVGGRCRFRSRENGRWYSGVLVGILPVVKGQGGKEASALVRYARPTCDAQVMCRFFRPHGVEGGGEGGRGGSCKRGDGCRFSHGVEVPAGMLLPPSEGGSASVEVGSRVLAEVVPGGLWSLAEVEGRAAPGAWDVVFVRDGRRARLPQDAVAGAGGDEGTDSEGGEESGSEDSELEGEGERLTIGGLGLGGEGEGGGLSTASFAGWEAHTRGVASKLMAKMGFVAGEGLGKGRGGQRAPLVVRVLRPQAGLGRGSGGAEVGSGGAGGRKKSRGGQRARNKKYADKKRKREEAAAIEGEDVETKDGSGVFGIINTMLGGGGESGAGAGSQGGGASAALWGDRASPAVPLQKEGVVGARAGEGRAAGGGNPLKAAGKGKAGKGKGGGGSQRDVLRQQEAVEAARARISRYEQMVDRNRGDKAVLQAALAKLQEARKQLADAEGGLANTQRGLSSSKAVKAMMKF